MSSKCFERPELLFDDREHWDGIEDEDKGAIEGVGTDKGDAVIEEAEKKEPERPLQEESKAAGNFT